ncbi:class I SAM-dependent methyltransferase [Burkholderia sp. 22PA0099]|uniref:class I SAM-dependent methyltransferase n=1 Tax=Burkholderia sp. 22PA0099 TaxID=3237372 RepID=UPI0039C0757A
MDDTPAADNTQAALWNGSAARAWIAGQTMLDGMFEPFEALLVDAIDAGAKRRVLDIGCGTGATTLAAARRLGADGEAVGVDISAPMIEVARRRTGQLDAAARFIAADVQTHRFEPASFDLIMSRFGVMFFDDPLFAFTNVRRAAKDGAELRCIAWRSAADNPFMTVAERAAAPFLPNLPARRPDGPGQFSFADSHRVASMLERSGWTQIDIRAIDVDCVLPETELVDYFSRVGPVGMLLQQTSEPIRSQVVKSVRAAFDPYVQESEVRYTAACWMLGARALDNP